MLRTLLYFALGIIALYFPVIIVSNGTYVAPLGRESELPRTRVATWRSLLQKTQFLTVRSIIIAPSGTARCRKATRFWARRVDVL